jgi:hypothetical protein
MNRFQKLVASIGLVVAASLGWGQAKAFLEKHPNTIPVESLQEFQNSIPESELHNDVEYLTNKLKLAKTPGEKAKAQALTREYLSAAAFAEGIKADSKAQQTISKIKQDPTFAGQKSFTSSNWYEKMMKRLGNVDGPDVKPPTIDAPEISGLEGWIRVATVIAVIIMIGIIITAIVAIVRLVMIRQSNVAAAKLKGSKRGSMLEDGEELLAEDEYLKLADDLIAQGKFREASRMLYLAILLRSDSLRICRFDSAQTNWEHNARFESSRRRPSDIQIRSATQAFDLAWYGFRAKSLADIEILRTTYLQLRSCKPVEVPA